MTMHPHELSVADLTSLLLAIIALLIPLTIRAIHDLDRSRTDPDRHGRSAADAKIE